MQDTIIPPASRLGSVQEYYFSKKLREIADMRSRGIDVLNLGIGSPDLPPSEAVVEELGKWSRQPSAHGYQPYKGMPELRRAFASWYANYFDVALDPDSEILPLIGSKEGIVHIAMTFLEAGDVALVPNPGYPSYRAASALAGAKVLEYKLSEENGWLPDLEALEQQDLSRVKIMWLNYPHMPTGAQANRALFEKLIAFALRHKVLLVNDNPYSFILNDRHLSLLSISRAKEVALELNSLSKSHNMAGWRLGMLAGDAALLDLVVRFKSNVDSGMFKPVQIAAVRALQAPPEWYEHLNETYRRRREKVYELLNMTGCTWHAGQAGLFVLAKVPAQFRDGFELSDYLLEKTHIFLTPGGIFGLQANGYVRVSLCSSEETLESAINRLAAQNLLLPTPQFTNSPIHQK
jgi:LL-diaminopimelate aminotransferase